MLRHWRVRYSYPASIVESVVHLEPIHGAAALSRLLDIPTSVIYRWRTKYRNRLAPIEDSTVEAAALATLVVHCEEFGFHGTPHARAPDTPASFRLPEYKRPTGRYVFDPRKERTVRGVRNRMSAARQVVDTQYFLEVDCRTLAATARMSLHHFIRMFGDLFGASPHQYLMRVRVEAAKRLLLVSNEPIEVIAAGVGFRSGMSLNRAFKRIEGTSVSKYCKTLRKGGTGRIKSGSMSVAMVDGSRPLGESQYL